MRKPPEPAPGSLADEIFTLVHAFDDTYRKDAVRSLATRAEVIEHERDALRAAAKALVTTRHRCEAYRGNGNRCAEFAVARSIGKDELVCIDHSTHGDHALVMRDAAEIRALAALLETT